DFDPATTPRFFSPFALYFNHTPAATSFLELAVQLEQAYTGDASDDFFLQEAWLQHQEQLNVLVLSPKLVGLEWPLQGEQVIYFGSSGNVKKFIGQAMQHQVPVLEAARRKIVLVKEAEAALNADKDDEALVLYRRALRAEPNEEALAKTVARMERRRRGHRHEASAHLQFLRRRHGPRHSDVCAGDRGSHAPCRNRSGRAALSDMAAARAATVAKCV